MYSFSYLELVCCSMSSSNCCFLICIQVSQRKVRWSGIPVSLRIFQFLLIHRVKGFGIVNKSERDVFLELSCFFSDPTDTGNLISGPPAFSKTSLNIWKFTVNILLKPGLESFTLLACEMSAMVQQFEHSLALPFFRIGMKTDLFQSYGPCLFSKFAGILSAALPQQHLFGFEIAQLELSYFCFYWAQLQLLHHYWSGHRLGLPWYWTGCLENEQRSFSRFWDCIQVLHLGLFYWLWWLFHFS